MKLDKQSPGVGKYLKYHNKRESIMNEFSNEVVKKDVDGTVTSSQGQPKEEVRKNGTSEGAEPQEATSEVF